MNAQTTNAYIIYRGEKIPVEVESTYFGGTGRIANVKAVAGYPFCSADVMAQGDTSGPWNCNGYRVRCDFVMLEMSEAEREEQEVREVIDWLGVDEKDWQDQVTELRTTI